METLFPSLPPSSRSLPSIVATLRFVPDPDRMIAPGRAEIRPHRASQPVEYRILLGNVPLTPHRAAIPGTAPLRNRGASFGAVALHHRVVISDANPFPRRTGSCRPRPSSIAVPARSGPAAR